MRNSKLLFLSLLVVIFSCKKDTIDTPVEDAVKACILGQQETERANDNNYVWCGANANTIEWSVNGKVMATGNSFTPQFTAKGKYTIRAKGTNSQGSDESALDVWYGKNAKIVCKIINPNLFLGNRTKFKAYLYNSKADWITDAVNSNHRLAIDSVQCRDTTGLDNVTHFAFFKNVYEKGSTKHISVEYADPQRPKLYESNWYASYNASEGNVKILNPENANDTCSTVLDRFTKMIFTNKWRLSEADTGLGYATATFCLSDDYVRFYADGKWKYFTGDDVCFEGDAPCSGAIGKIPFLNDGSLVNIATKEGSVRSRLPYGWEMNGSLDSKFYLFPSGMLIFVPDW